MPRKRAPTAEQTAALFDRNAHYESDSSADIPLDPPIVIPPPLRRSNYVHNSGRRKIGRAERAERERLRAQEFEGLRGTYTDDIGWALTSRRMDPERTEDMRRHERQLYKSIVDLREAFRQRPMFRYAYIRRLETLQRLEQRKKKKTHASRRILAIYAQEHWLWWQGEHAYDAARQDGVLVAQGNGVNKHTARRMFGF